MILVSLESVHRVLWELFRVDGVLCSTVAYEPSARIPAHEAVDVGWGSPRMLRLGLPVAQGVRLEVDSDGAKGRPR